MMFSLTPIEGALWHLGVAAQASIAIKVFGNIVFTGIVVFFLMRHVLKALSLPALGQGGEQVAKQLIGYGFCVVIGLTFLRSVATTPFSPEDGNGREWSSYRYVQNSTDFQNLRNSTDGLWWYRLLHGSTNSISKYMTKIAGSVFKDSTYTQSTDLMFKLLVSTASVEIDNPKVAAELDNFLAQCSDTRTGNLMSKTDTLGDLMDLQNPECAKRYRDLHYSLKNWANRALPAIVRKVSNTDPSELPSAVRGLSSLETLENKVIGSALINYGQTKSRTYLDGINTNTKELGIQDREDHFWFTLQRALSGGAWPALLANLFAGQDGSVESSIHRNEARIIYNNLLNLLPAFKGYVKVFIAIAFVFAAAGLCLGFTKPMLWWGSLLLMDMVYEPLSTLNYQIHSMMLASSDIGWAFGELSRDPMALMGAALIDSKLLQYQTAYFLAQFVIAAIFVIGIIGSGFAIQKMSFSQGAGFMALGGLANNRLVGYAARGVGNMATKIRSRV